MQQQGGSPGSPRFPNNPNNPNARPQFSPFSTPGITHVLLVSALGFACTLVHHDVSSVLHLKESEAFSESSVVILSAAVLIRCSFYVLCEENFKRSE